MRKSIGWIGVVVVATALAVLPALPTGAGRTGAAPLHVRKVVVGPVPAETQFVVVVSCDDDIVFNGSGGSSATLVFDAQGNPVGTGDTVTFTNEGECTVTETQNSGAASVSYQCEGSVSPPTTASGASVLDGAGRFSPRVAGLRAPAVPDDRPAERADRGEHRLREPRGDGHGDEYVRRPG